MSRIRFVVIGDLIAFWASFFVVLSIRFWQVFPTEVINTHLYPFIILCLCWLLCFFLFGLYDLFTIKPIIPHLRRFGIGLITCFIIGIFLFYLVPAFGISPKTNLLFQVLGFGILSFFFRRIFYLLFSKQIIRPVIIVGKTSYTEELFSAIKKSPQLGLNVISYTNNLYDSLRQYSELKNSVFIFEKNLDEIPEKDMLNLYKNKTEIIEVAEAYERYLVKIPIDYISSSWIVENIKTRSNFFYDFSMRIFDILLSFFILVISIPFLIVSAIFIYLHDKGPIFYIQERVGLNGKLFRFYKLRSMVIDSEKNGAIWTAKDDPRITSPGKIIRKLHIDEIPQMINILKGDMTLIGPRPEWVEFVRKFEQVIPHYDLRHIVRPGFTGWAQIKYKYTINIEDTKEKFGYDLYYIKNRNIFLDFGIILKTIQIIFTH
jgi:exopolysaccharide biosynthesis polyprenyl glycosylphosphotransferase